VQWRGISNSPYCQATLVAQFSAVLDHSSRFLSGKWTAGPRVGGGPVSANPGPTWRAIEAGGFNGDGVSDGLFPNTSSGQVSIWEMDDNTRVEGGAVFGNPGSTWRVIGI
jgi:hypothetical protein